MAHYVEHPNWEINHADMKDKAEKKPDLLAIRVLVDAVKRVDATGDVLAWKGDVLRQAAKILNGEEVE